MNRAGGKIDRAALILLGILALVLPVGFYLLGDGGDTGLDPGVPDGEPRADQGRPARVRSEAPPRRDEILKGRLVDDQGRALDGRIQVSFEPAPGSGREVLVDEDGRPVVIRVAVEGGRFELTLGAEQSGYWLLRLRARPRAGRRATGAF